MAPGQVLVKDAPREEVTALHCFACHFSFSSVLTIYITELDTLTSSCLSF